MGWSYVYRWSVLECYEMICNGDIVVVFMCIHIHQYIYIYIYSIYIYIYIYISIIQCWSWSLPYDLYTAILLVILVLHWEYWGWMVIKLFLCTSLLYHNVQNIYVGTSNLDMARVYPTYLDKFDSWVYPTVHVTPWNTRWFRTGYQFLGDIEFFVF